MTVSSSQETCLSSLFHLIQLLSNFFKYSSSNFLLSHLNKIFTVYFTDNSLLLNTSTSGFNYLSFPISFLICTLFISSSLIFFLNSSTKSIAFLKFSNLSHVSFSTVYLFHLTKYSSFPFTSLLFNIFSTSYSFSLFIFTREGGIFFYFSTYP